MSDLFEASRVKVQRAKKHIAELEAFLANHDKNKPPIVTFTPAQEGQEAALNITTFSPPKEFSAIVGDAIHNLRAPLDLMAVELVKLSDPATSSKRVYFPFSEDESTLSKVIKDKYFHRAGADAVTLLKALRPYKGGNAALRGLHDLDSSDKHKELIPNAATITSNMLRANVDNFPDIVIELVEGSSPDVRLVFPDDWPFARDEIIPTLHSLVQLVESILESFSALVAGRRSP